MKIEHLCTVVFNTIHDKETSKEIYSDVSEFLNKRGFLIIEGEDAVNRNIRVYREVKENEEKWSAGSYIG